MNNPQQKLITLSDVTPTIEVFIVGGYVRDRLLGRECKDHDFVVVGASIEQMLQLGFQQVGADFPVFLAPNGDEFALARTERKTGNGYGGFTTSIENVSIEQDLFRRDLTINAMARRVINFNDYGHAILTNTILDPYGGEADLKFGRLAHVSEAFAEDPLRVLRVARFAARYGFTVMPETLELMKNLTQRGELKFIAKERMWQEVTKAMMEDQPSLFWVVLSIVGAGNEVFPELNTRTLIEYAHHLSPIDKNDLPMRMAVLLHTFNPDQVLVSLVEIKAPLDVIRVAHNTAILTAELANTLNLDAAKAIELLVDIGAFRRPTEFYNAIVPILSMLGYDWQSEQLITSLVAAQSIKFDSLTTHEKQTLRGKAIKDRLTQMQIAHSAQALSHLNTEPKASN